MKLSSKEVCIKLAELCEKKENDTFVKLFIQHPLFNCDDIVGGWGDYWGDPHEYHAYAFYLAYYHKNADLVDMLIQIAETFSLFREKDDPPKRQIQRARLYAAGASANFEDDFLRKIRRAALSKWNWLYIHFLEGLWHAKHYKELAEELLSEKNQLWFAYPRLRFFPPEIIYQEIDEKDLGEKANDNNKHILVSLACKLFWLKTSKVAVEYLKNPSEETKKKIDGIMDSYIGECSISLFSLECFPNFVQNQHVYCDHK